MLRSVSAVVDGLKLLMEQIGDSVIQEMFYNGWSHDLYVSNVLCSRLAGFSWHASSMRQELFMARALRNGLFYIKSWNRCLMKQVAG